MQKSIQSTNTLSDVSTTLTATTIDSSTVTFVPLDITEYTIIALIKAHPITNLSLLATRDFGCQFNLVVSLRIGLGPVPGCGRRIVSGRRGT